MKQENPHGVLIEPRLRELHEKLQKLSVDEEMFRIIHGPGWTTLIDVYFIRQSIEAMHQQADALSDQLKTLTVASNMIKQAAE